MHNTIAGLLRNSMKKPAEKPEVKKIEAVTLDAVVEKEPVITFDAAADYTTKDIKLKAMSMVQQWVETEDLDDGESIADRLLAMMVGIADSNKDGEITDDEQDVINIALEAAHDYLDKYGVDPDDASLLLNDWDAEAAERIRDLLVSSMPDGDEADDEINSAVFDAISEPVEEEEKDSSNAGDDAAEDATLDATYKKKTVIRKGKKVRINKRIAGKVRLSARQKVAIRKAQMKSHRGAAQMKRKKSNKIRKNMGLK